MQCVVSLSLHLFCCGYRFCNTILFTLPFEQKPFMFRNIQETHKWHESQKISMGYMHA